MGLIGVVALCLCGCDDDIGFGQTLEPFTVEAADGAMVTIPGEQAGKNIVLAFWVSWCAPCRQELVELQMVADREGESLAVVAINVGESPAASARSMAAVGGSLVSLYDPDASIASRFGIHRYPHTIIVDRRGLIRSRLSEPVTAPQLQEMLRRFQ